jgi:putative NADH-flavin reductase
VFGASGGTGREVVTQALARGFSVTAFVRDSAKLAMAHDNLRIVQGDVSDARAVDEAVTGQAGVISTLGVGTPLTHDPVVIEGVRSIVRSAEQRSVRRLVYLSFIGVGDSRDAAGFLLKRMAALALRHEVADHEAKEALVMASPVDWTIVRPPKLTNGRLTASYRAGEHIRARSPLPMLSRADVADFMLRQLSETTFIRRVARILH